MFVGRQPLPPWVFLDYVVKTARGGQRNVIEEWLLSIPSEARVEFHAFLDNTIRPKERLSRPETGILFGDCAGLYEFIFDKNNVQYRPIFAYGPGRREITILAGATKTGGKKKGSTKWDPPNVCDTAQQRYRDLENKLVPRVLHVRV